MHTTAASPITAKPVSSSAAASVGTGSVLTVLCTPVLTIGTFVDVCHELRMIILFVLHLLCYGRPTGLTIAATSIATQTVSSATGAGVRASCICTGMGTWTSTTITGTLVVIYMTL